MKKTIAIVGLFFVCGTGASNTCSVAIQAKAPKPAANQVVIEDKRRWSDWVKEGLKAEAAAGKVTLRGKKVYVGDKPWL